MQFVVGMGDARGAVQRWTVRRYLPVTDWDSGVRNSVTTGVGYLGVSIAVLGALAASGLGFNQIALIASALSVGIGFGLQQVVQNFVSGVILLVEAAGEGRRTGWLSAASRATSGAFAVRATEIETADRTTGDRPQLRPDHQVGAEPRRWGESGSLVQLQLSIAKAEDVQAARAS